MHHAYDLVVLAPGDQRTANLLGALALAVNDRLSATLEAATGLGASAPAALATLLTYRDREMTIERLRLVLGLSHSATVRLVDRLASTGLVERRVAADGRAVALTLTRNGRRAAERIRGARQRLLESLLVELAAPERAAVGRLAEALLAGLTSSRREARHICRLCDHGVCERTAYCPVDDAATAAGE